MFVCVCVCVFVPTRGFKVTCAITLTERKRFFRHFMLLQHCHTLLHPTPRTRDERRNGTPYGMEEGTEVMRDRTEWKRRRAATFVSRHVGSPYVSSPYRSPRMAEASGRRHEWRARRVRGEDYPHKFQCHEAIFSDWYKKINVAGIPNLLSIFRELEFFPASDRDSKTRHSPTTHFRRLSSRRFILDLTFLIGTE